jgi:hypothetical protein
MIHGRKSVKLAIFCCILLCLIQNAAAFTFGSVSIKPSGNLYPGDSVNVSYTVYAASGTAFPLYDDLQFITDLDNPQWTYAIAVNGAKNTRPVTGGRTVTITGFELHYRDQDEVIVSAVLQGTIPPGTALGTNRTLVKIQELDARGYSIPYSVITVDHRIGEPTPPPTPAYGSITVSSSPSGANIYIDNVYKGISPATFSDVPNGNHVVLMRLEGYPDLTKGVTVSGDNQTLHGVLSQQTAFPVTSPSPGQTGSPAPATPGQAQGYGSLSITTSPPGALVYVDGVMKGISPTTIPMLSEGPHSLTLVMDGYQDLKTTITINAGTTSEYITGLSKAEKTPGFAAGIAVISIIMLFLCRKIRK